MKRILALLLIGIFFTACSDDEKVCCTIIDTGISIKYLNENGENLFEIPDGLSESDITVYHKTNGEWVRYFKANMDSPKGITTVEKEDGTYLVVFPSTAFVEKNYSETKIQFSDTDADIITTEIDKSNSSEIVTKVWYNGELKWEAGQTERTFEIVK